LKIQIALYFAASVLAAKPSMVKVWAKPARPGKNTQEKA